MQVVGAARKAVPTPSTTPSAPNGAGAASSGSAADLPMTREQIQRDRYLKTIKNRKCSACGNNARTRCPFQACQTCCMRARNPCPVHVYKPNKQMTGAPTLNPRDQNWSATVSSMPASMGSPYMRPPYVPASAYHSSPGITGMRPHVGYATSTTQSGHHPHAGASPSARPWRAVGATLEQQELYRLKALKLATQAAHREAAMINLWRFQKLREHLDGEIVIEDEAFDRYMHNMLLLEEVFLVNRDAPEEDSSDGELIVEEGVTHIGSKDMVCPDSFMLPDGTQLQWWMNGDRKEASQQRRKRTVERRLQMLSRGEQETEDVQEYEDMIQVVAPEAQRDLKRFKPQTKEGKECLERIGMFQALLQKTNQIQVMADVDSCVEMYRQRFGPGLDTLLSPLSGIVECVGAEVGKEHDVGRVVVSTSGSEFKEEEAKNPLLPVDHQAALDTPFPDKEDGVLTSQVSESETVGFKVHDLEAAIEGKRLTREDTSVELQVQDLEAANEGERSTGGDTSVGFQVQDLEAENEGERLIGEESSCGLELQRQEADHQTIVSKKSDQVSSGEGSGGLSKSEKITTTESKQQHAGKRHWSQSQQGALVACGWWKVDLDENSAQAVCQSFLKSTESVEVL